MTLSTDNKPIVRKSALGKGFSSLLGDIEMPIAPPPARMEAHVARVEMPVVTVQNNGLMRIRVADIEPNPHQPRKLFNPEELTALSKSLKEDGILQPILVSKGERPNSYVLIAGERRWRAAQMAGLEVVPAVVREGVSNDMLRLALIENIQRSDLNPIEEAEAYQSLIKDFGLTQEQCAVRLGKERSTVANSLRLLALPRELQDDLVDGRLSMGHGRAILGLDEKSLMKEARDVVLKKGLSVRQTEDLCRAMKEGKRVGAEAKPAQRPNANYIANSLCQHLKTKVTISGNGNKGKIQIAFNTADDFDRILVLLGLQR